MSVGMRRFVAPAMLVWERLMILGALGSKMAVVGPHREAASTRYRSGSVPRKGMAIRFSFSKCRDLSRRGAPSLRELKPIHTAAYNQPIAATHTSGKEFPDIPVPGPPPCKYASYAFP